jgi:hypothetical protein
MPNVKKNPAPFRMNGYSYPGTSPMKQDKMARMQKTTNAPSKKEKDAITLHKSNLKDYPELYKDSQYDERKANNAKILKKYPNYNWDQ